MGFMLAALTRQGLSPGPSPDKVRRDNKCWQCEVTILEAHPCGSCLLCLLCLRCLHPSPAFVVLFFEKNPILRSPDPRSPRLRPTSPGQPCP